MRPLALILLVAGACRSGATYVEVHVTAGGPPLVLGSLAVTAIRDDGQRAVVTVGEAAAPFDVPPEQSFILELDPQAAGSLTVEVVALDVHGATLATGSGLTALVRGGIARLTIPLGGSVADGGTSDGSDGSDPLLTGFSVVASPITVEEHQGFNVHLTARTAGDRVHVGYQGTPAFSSDWGDVTVRVPPVFANGEADATVSLNRETPDVTHFAHLTVRDGRVGSASQGITVNAPVWTVVDTAPVILPAMTGWDVNISNPSWVRRGGQDLVLYHGSNNSNSTVGIGLTTSTDGVTWTRRTAPVLADFPEDGWAPGASPSRAVVQPDGNDLVAFYLIFNFGQYGIARSSDGGVSWTRDPKPIAFPTSTGCTTATLEGAFLVEPQAPQRFLATLIDFSNPCFSRSDDDGMTWSTRASLSAQPAPFSTSNDYVILTQLLKEGSVYRLWYSASVGSGWTRYATSTDGQSWVLSQSVQQMPHLETVVWNEVALRFDALVDPGNGFLRWTRR